LQNAKLLAKYPDPVTLDNYKDLPEWSKRQDGKAKIGTSSMEKVNPRIFISFFLSFSPSPMSVGSIPASVVRS